MPESNTESQKALKTEADIRASQFGVTENRFKREDWGYTADYDSKKGGAIGAYRFKDRAALLQAFSFDEFGELQSVFVEKRLLEEAPKSSEEGVEHFELELGEGKVPFYRLRLVRGEDGKFVVKERVTGLDRKKWEAQFHRATFRQPPPK